LSARAVGLVGHRASQCDVHWEALPYRFFFYWADRDEPLHVHVARDCEAKFWLEPVRLQRSRGFGRVEIGRIEKLVAEKAAFLLREWHEYFGD